MRRLTRGCDTALDGAVVLLATWTFVYHACLILRLGVLWAVCLEAVALAICAVVAWRSRQGDDQSDHRQLPAGSTAARSHASLPASTTVARVLVKVTVVTGALAAVLLAINATWTVVAILWLAAAVAGTGWALVSSCHNDIPPPSGGATADAAATDRPWETWVALGWATAMSTLSVFTLWPNPDDLYYVNLSQWVVDHGTFPLRDTIFADLVFPMSSWPPMASYDALAGTVGWLCGVHAATVVYMVVPPVATFLSVLAMWMLLRTWRVRHVAVALSLGLIFLLFDGGPGYAAPGNLFLIRIWQGKVILLCLLVPILLVYAVRYAEHPTRRRAGWLFAGGVAAVGLSTTAMFLVPLIALAGAAPLVLRRPALAWQGFAAMAAYPLATGIFTKAVHGRSADLFDSRALFRFEPEWFGHEIFRDGPLAVIAVAAVLAGALLVPHPAARVTTGCLAIVTGLTFIPGVTHLSYDLVGLGPTLWRVSWVASVAALVGVLGARLVSHASRRAFQVLGPVALAAVLVAFGLPIWSERNGVSVESGPHWQRGPDSVASAQEAINASRPGDLILAPQELAITIDVLTTRVKTVAPRDYFMDYLRDDPAFHYPARLTLVDFSNQGFRLADELGVARALTLLDVDLVCLPVEARKRIRFVHTQGYRWATGTTWDSCLTR